MRSLATDGDSGRVMMTSTIVSGCDAESVCRAGRPSPSCPIGWRRPGTIACGVDSNPASGLPWVIRSSKQRRTAKIRHACPIHPPCADGRNGDYSVCGAGRELALKANTFCRRPPSLPGIWARSAVFCRSRPEVRESPSSRRVETADSAAGLAEGIGVPPPSRSPDLLTAIRPRLR